MQGIAKQNGEIKYLIIVIDVFFKFAWEIPVHFKDAKAIIKTFRQVLTTAKSRHYHWLQTDKGKKYLNSNFQALMKSQGIQHCASKSKKKSTVVKQFNRTNKPRIWKYLSNRGSVLWVNVSQDLVDAYNNSRLRFIGMAPADVQK